MATYYSNDFRSGLKIMLMANLMRLNPGIRELAKAVRLPALSCAAR